MVDRDGLARPINKRLFPRHVWETHRRIYGFGPTLVESHKSRYTRAGITVSAFAQTDLFAEVRHHSLWHLLMVGRSLRGLRENTDREHDYRNLEA